jgi:hypothetical protein
MTFDVIQICIISLILGLLVGFARFSNNILLEWLIRGVAGAFMFWLIHNAVQALYSLIHIAN